MGKSNKKPPVPITLSDIEQRVRLMYAGIKLTSPVDLKLDELKLKSINDASGISRGIHFDWAFDRTEDELFSLAMMAIDNIGSFYEPLWRYGLTHGFTQKDVDKACDRIIAIRIVTDLHNVRKHPTQNVSWSGLNPRLQNVTQYPVLGPGGKVELFWVPLTGAMDKRIVGQVSLSLKASIINFETKQEIAQLDELLDESSAAYVDFLKQRAVI